MYISSYVTAAFVGGEGGRTSIYTLNYLLIAPGRAESGLMFYNMTKRTHAQGSTKKDSDYDNERKYPDATQ